MKVFDVLLNGDHLVVDGLDIFERAGGRAAAYDVHVPFKVNGNKLVLLNSGEESDLPATRTLRLDFVKVYLFVSFWNLITFLLFHTIVRLIASLIDCWFVCLLSF